MLTSFIPSVVVLDLPMPGVDGYQVLEYIRNSKELAATKVLTGENEVGQRFILKKERRKARRICPVNQLKGKLSLYVEGLYQDVIAVQDASPYGVCVLIDRAVDKDVRVILTYQDESISLEILGAAAWSLEFEEENYRRNRSQLYRVGISFSQENMQPNTLFFRSINGLE